MNIAIIANTAWNLYNFRLGLIRALIADGHRVLAIAPPDEYTDKIVSAGVQFLPIHRLSRKGTNPVQDLQLLHELTQIYKRERVHLAMHYTIKPNIYGTLAANLTGTISFCTVTGLGYTFLSSGIASLAAKRLYKYAFKKAEKVWFQNRDDLSLFIKTGLVAPANAAVVPGSGIDVDKFSPQFNVCRDDHHFRFLFIGRLLYDKGIRELLAAFDQVSRTHSHADLHIIGAYDPDNPSGLSRAEFDAYLSQHPTVTYVGTTDDVRSHIAQADAVVLPSYREGLPRVMLEGMAMGKPLITTDVPGCRETVIPGKNGFLAAAQDASSLSQAMQQMMELSPAQLRAMATHSRQMAQNTFAESVIIRTYLTAIRSLPSR